MKTLQSLFGESPFVHLVEHAQKIHGCVTLIRPVANAILTEDMAALNELHQRISRMEYEADTLKDHIRESLPSRFFLPVNRDDILKFMRQLDRMGDDAENFAVIATFRPLHLPEAIQAPFLSLVDKVVQVSEALLAMAEELTRLQRESFTGSEAQSVLDRIKQVCHMEWESDRLSQELARQYYGREDIDPVTIILLDKLCRSLTGIADHAENVGKNLRLLICRS